MSYHPAPLEHEGTFVISSGTPDRAADVEILGDQEVAMEDGTRLGADVYLPRGVERVPAVLIRQPYGRRTDWMGLDVVASFFARKGYACVVQDVRGRFSSGGVFDPMVNEVGDGYDTVDWAATQEWCNGRVGLWGESYYGFTSYAAAISGHPAIACIAPGDIGLDRRAVWFRQGAFLLNTAGYWALAMDSKEYADVAGVDPYHVPLRDLPSSVGLEGDLFVKMLDHVDDAEWWRERSLSHRLRDVKVPVLAWSGWYDNYLGQLLADYQTLASDRPSTRPVHLFVGPWDHEGSADYTERAVCQRVTATAPHRWETYLAFLDHYLMGIDNGFGDRGPVEVYVLGADRWRTLPSWPPPGVVETPLYLRGGGSLSFELPSPDEPPDAYDYDPADPVAGTVGRNCWALCTTLDDRRHLDHRADILRYSTDPLAEDLVFCGPLTAWLYASSSATDTDFTVTLCDVFENGTVNTIQDGIVRARYRAGLNSPAPIESGQIEEYRIDLFATSYVVRRGHRLRVDVSSSDFDRYDRNPNTGDPWGSSDRMLIAKQQIHHSPGRESRVVLPVVHDTWTPAISPRGPRKVAGAL